MQTSGQSQPLPGSVLGEAAAPLLGFRCILWVPWGHLSSCRREHIGSTEPRGQRSADAEVGRCKDLKSRGSLSSCQAGIWSNKGPVERNTVRPAWKAFLTQQAMQKEGAGLFSYSLPHPKPILRSGASKLITFIFSQLFTRYNLSV